MPGSRSSPLTLHAVRPLSVATWRSWQTDQRVDGWHDLQRRAMEREEPVVGDDETEGSPDAGSPLTVSHSTRGLTSFGIRSTSDR